MSSARRANPYSACTAGRCSGASNRVARKKVLPCAGVDLAALPVRLAQATDLAHRRRRARSGSCAGFHVAVRLTCRHSGDPVGGQPPGHDRGRHARRPARSRNRPARRCRRRGRCWPAGTVRSGRRCAPARTGCPPPCPAGPSRPGVTTCSTSTSSPSSGQPVGDRVEHARRRRPTRWRPSRPVATGIRRGRQDVEQVTTGRRQAGVAGGRAGSPAATGPASARPSSMMSRNVCSHASPNRIVWWRGGLSRQPPRQPTWATTADGDGAQPQQPTRRAAQQPVGVGELGGQHDGVAGDALTVGRCGPR